MAGRKGAGRGCALTRGCARREAGSSQDHGTGRARHHLGTALNPVLEVVLRSVSVLVVFLVLPLLVGQTEHKVMAHMQGRLGPMYAGGYHGWAQLVADAAKFVQKEDIVPRAADRWVFKLAPGVALVPYLVALSVIPLSATVVGGYHGWAQLVADAAKFVQKEDIVPRAADRW